jgi:hypothetical protein
VPAPEDTEAPAEADETEEEDDTTDDTDDTEQTPKMAAGGMASRPAVGYYADGGTAQQFPPVQDNDASQTAVSQPAVGDPAPLPASPPPTPPPPPAASASKKGWNNSIGFNTSEVIDSWKNAPEPEGWSKQGAVGEAPKKDPTDVNPVRFGLAAMQEAYSTSKGASALDKGHSAMVEAVTKKPNAMSDAQYQQIAKVVDPHDELTENARLIASLNAGVKNALSKGDVKSAKALAVGMVEMSAINSEKFGRYAMELMQKGDAQGAVTFLQKAYDVMPDGKKIEAFIGPDNLVHARTIDSDGNAQDLGKFGGPQLVKLATGVANGSTYWQTMSQIAGMKPDKPTQQPKPMGVPKLSDRTNAAKNIEDAASGFELGKETEGTVKSIASQIHVSNDADPAMSIRAALKLTDAKNAPDYKLTPSQDGSATAEFKDGSVIKLSRNALAQIALARASAQKGKEAADAKTAEEQAQEKKKQGLISDLQTQQAAERDKQRSKVMTPGAIGRGAYIPELNRPPQ